MAEPATRGLFEELKTRSVFRVGAMYLIVAWVLLQVSDVVSQPLELPRWFERALIVVLACGLPISLCLAWIFDVTPRGLVRASESTYSESDRLHFARKVDLAIIGFLGLALALSVYAYEQRIDALEGGAAGPSDAVALSAAENADLTPSSAPAASQRYLLIGNLVDFTGETATSGLDYGQAIIDSANWINESGGIDGKLIDLDTVETSYLARRALAAYRKWRTQGVIAIQGWGTQIGQALTEPVAQDHVPYFSASYAASFTDPAQAPYNFFYGPSYSDGCRGLVQWAHDDWIKSRSTHADSKRQPRYVHMGDNHPYPNAPKYACENYAKELGFEVLPAIIVPLIAADFTVQCRALKQADADYAFLANTDNSVIALLLACRDVGVATQFLANIWGYDEHVMQAAGVAADGVVWVMGAAKWGDEAPGMSTVREISRMSDPGDRKYRTVHYIRGICSMFYLRDAMEWANLNGGISGENVRQAMYEHKGPAPAGLEGVCLPAKWTATDHRGVTQVLIYRGTVKSATDGEIEDLIERGVIRLDRIYSADIPRRPEWLGV